MADNGQAKYGSTGHGRSLSCSNNNPKNVNQSTQEVDDSFPNYRIQRTSGMTLLPTESMNMHKAIWMTAIVGTTPDEKNNIIVSYPKFQTKYRTFISFKMGIWYPVNKTYDSSKFKK